MSNITTNIYIPELGEGLAAVKILRLLVKPGDIIQEDQVIYEVETHKSIMEIESSYSGKLVAWHGEVGQIIPTNQKIAEIEVPTANECSFGEPLHFQASTENHNNKIKFDSADHIPLRAKLYAQQNKIPMDQLLKIDPKGRRLLPADIDNYLKNTENSSSSAVYANKNRYALSSAQKKFINNYINSKAIPASINFAINAQHLKQIRTNMYSTISEGSNYSVTDFAIFSFLVAQTTKKNPKFRSIVTNDEVIEYEHVNIGIAVEKNDDFDIVVISSADDFDENDYFESYQRNILDGAGVGQMDIAHLTLSYLGDISYLGGSPTLVSPSVATIYFGGLNSGERSQVYVSITFDHRLINGTDIRKFINDLNQVIEVRSRFVGRHENIKGMECSNTRTAVSARDNIKQILKSALQDITNTNEEILDDVPLGMYNLDSLKSTQFINKINQNFNTNISITVVWKYPTLEKLTNHVDNLINMPSKISISSEVD